MPDGLRLKEAYGLDSVRHDRDSGIVYGVKFLGLKSRNRKEYLKAAAKNAIPLIEAATVYVDHAPDTSRMSPSAKPARSVTHRFGRPINVSQNTAGDIVGDFRYNKSHPYAAQFADDVDNNPVGLGFSIDAYGMGVTRPDGTKEVQEITKLHSVDIVDNPATCYTLWEQTMDDTPSATIDPMGGVSNGSDWKNQVGDLLKAIASDTSMDKATIKKKIMHCLKLLDDGEKEDGADIPDDNEMMEQLKDLGIPLGRKSAKRLGVLVLKERKEERKQQAINAKLMPEALTEQFLYELVAAPLDKVSSIIMDRKKLIEAVENKIKPVKEPISLTESKNDGFDKLKGEVKDVETYKKEIANLSASMFG